jgi:hypothetical protein
MKAVQRVSILAISFFLLLVFTITPGFVSKHSVMASQNGTWSFTGSMNDPRTSFAATLLQNGKVLVEGGLDSRHQIFL